MVLPLIPLMSLTPHVPRGGCFNLLAAPITLAFFGAAFVISLMLIAVGISAIVLAALQARGGITTAVIVNVIVATLLLAVPLGLIESGPLDSGSRELAALLAGSAVFPLAGASLLLSRSLYRSSRTFVATLVVAGLLLVPGVASLAGFGLDLAGVAVFSAASSSTGGQAARC
jgi:hypothetical protein